VGIVAAKNRICDAMSLVPGR